MPNLIPEPYKEYQFRYVWRLFWQMLTTKDRLKRLSLNNKLKDYSVAVKDPALLALHGRLAAIREEQATHWPEYDYGEGYFYQSFAKLHLSGFRDTAYRFRAMELEKWTRDRTVLDIGCNAGYLAVQTAEVARHVTGMDINPYLIRFGQAAADYLAIKNIALHAMTFEDFASDETFDVIFSFANHSTYDGKTKHTIEEYFNKCHRYLKPDGILLFESHAPDYEGRKLDNVIEVIEKNFETLERKTWDGGSFLDRGRTYIVTRRRS